MRAILRQLARLFRSRRRFEAEMRDEFAFHVHARTEALIASGMTAADARRQARIEFGSVPGYEDRSRQAAGLRFLDEARTDFRDGLRMLWRQRGTTIVVALTLAIGIGANTALFSVVEANLLRRLAVTDPDRLALFTDDTSAGTISGGTPDGIWTLFSNASYENLRRAALPFTGIAAWASQTHTVTAAPPSGPDGTGRPGFRANVLLVSGNYFTVVGASPALGRVLRPEDDRPEAAPVAVISDRYWRNRLGADRNIVGQVTRLNATAFTIVGVMPESFFGLRVEGAPDFWVPMVRQPEIELREAFRDRQDYYWLSLVGRLAPGASLETASAATSSALRGFLMAQAGDTREDGVQARIRTVRVVMASGARGISRNREQNENALLLLFGAVGLVLLVACANVATLLLCRATSRSTEAAVRRALGASQLRLIRQSLTESLLVALLGAGLGTLVAYWTIPILQTYFPSGPMRAALNAPVLIFALGSAVLSSLLFGLAPAIQACRVHALAALRSAGRGTRRRKRRFGLTEPFVIAQIGISLVLVAGATLFARTLVNLEQAPLGFDQDRVLLVQINTRLAGYEPSDVGGLYRRLHEQVKALPGVEAATFARYSPLGGHLSSFGAEVDGYAAPRGERLRLEALEVGPDYPQTLGMPLVTGRAIDINDGPGRPRVAMVNEAFVRRFFPASSPLGRHFRLNEDYEIVGVVRDALFHSARDQMIPFVFIPTLQQNNRMILDCELQVRTQGDASALAPAVRDIVSRTDPRVGVTRTRTLREQVLLTFRTDREAAGFAAVIAGLGLLLAAIGLYGIVAHTVVRRTQEIGVRIALGASHRSVTWLLLRQTIRWLVASFAIGAIGSAAAGRVIASQLFGVSPGDILSFATASAILSLVAVAATLLPARRAVRIHPAIALRME